MKRAISMLLLLAPMLAFGQKFQDVSQKGSPVSLSIGFYPGDPNPYVFARNDSSKGVLALAAVANFKDASGHSVPLTTNQDYAFKFGVLKPHDKRGVGPVDVDPGITTTTQTMTSTEGGVSVTRVVQEVGQPDPTKNRQAVGNGAVLFVQFDDGTTWGDPASAKRLLDSRPQRLAYLKRLVETYYESGQDAFNAVLREPKPMSPESVVAGCLQGDAERDKIPTIELAKKRLADAQGWHASGIF
jgi:hypothetical protein